ncbi:hypothetical protein [Carboxylicivirga taeanensis]|uniref:hypothetical protein n=1 Tax=Carboxylicivirga taeanensis TaxID=1416875 RepID=UPI003F6DB908
MQLFTKAGIQNLAQLKHKTFDIESIQSSNLDKLKQYLENSRTYKAAMEEVIAVRV